MGSTLVGFTGFVGSNLAKSHKFDNLYNSQNITDAFKINHDLVVYAGVRAEKFLANSNPEADFRNIETAITNLKGINPKKFVLISTIDVYEKTFGVDEDYQIDSSKLQPYGKNRYFLEQWVENNIKDHLIVRLPALFGDGLKKNFLFDIINIIPTMIKPDKAFEIRSKLPHFDSFYSSNSDGFYKLNDNLSIKNKEYLKAFFQFNNFNALSFTDSRSSYQFYNLEYLWDHICTAIDNNLKLLNITTEPVIAGDLYEYLYNKKFINEFLPTPVSYDLKTKHASIFDGKDGYIFGKEKMKEDIKKFMERDRV